MVSRPRLLVLAVLLAVAAPALAQTCEDRDLDGFFSEDGCGTIRDCNDDLAAIFPGAVEICDGRDGDCNGFVDDSPSCDRTCDNPERLPVVTQVSLSATDPSDRGNVVWVGDGWVVVYLSFWQDACAEVVLQKLDPSGNPIGGPVNVSGGVGVFVVPEFPWLVWTGSELAVTWQEAPTTTCVFVDADRAFFRRFTTDLQPLGGRIDLDPSATGSGRARPTWTGNRYGAFWYGGGTTRFNTIDRDGGVPTSPIDGGGSISSEFLALAWNGTLFGVTWSDQPFDIYFRRVGEDLSLPDPAPIRETFEPQRAEWNSVVWADGEWAVTWSDGRDAPISLLQEIYFMRLDPAGAKVDPPGDVRITCCNDNAGGSERFFNKLLWTGEEFGLGYGEDTNQVVGGLGDVFIQRIDALGNTIGPPVSLTPGPAKFANRVDMDWNGKEYGVVWDDLPLGATPRQVMFARVGCNCTDVDGDLFSTCAGGDCNDDDPLVNPLQSESCLNGLDDNCDALADCQDPAACPADAGAPPPEVAGLGFDADAATMTWATEPAADVYDLLRGDLSELRADGDFSRAGCL